MEIRTTNRLAIIITILSTKLIWALILFAISVLVVALTLPDKYTALDSTLGWLKAGIIPLLFLFYHGVNAFVYSNKTRLQLKDNSLDLHSGNIFNNKSLAFTFPQISILNISQPFFQMIFGICQINILQEGGVVTHVWGFNMKEAQDFLNEFSKKFKVRVGK